MISDVKTTTGAENSDGEITCTLKFKVSRNSEDLDRWFWFCKNHEDTYDLEISETGFALTEGSSDLPPGQTTLDDTDEDGSVRGIVIAPDEDGVFHTVETFGYDDPDDREVSE